MKRLRLLCAEEEVLNSLGILPEDCEVSYVAYDTTGASQTASLEDVAEAVNATTEAEPSVLVPTGSEIILPSFSMPVPSALRYFCNR